MSSIIHEAVSNEDIRQVIELFTAYQKSLGIDLDFQNFENELATLPGKYAPPRGCLLLCTNAGCATGCVGLRPLDSTICEMKRLYVTPEGRGHGAGQALAEATLTKARQLGYTRIRLDTLRSMTAALKLYRGLGFQEIDSYYTTPLKDTVFLELVL